MWVPSFLKFSPTRGMVRYFNFSHSNMYVVVSHCVFFFFKYLFLFIYWWLCWVFVSVRGLSPVAASGGHSSSRCTGLSLLQPLLLRSTGSRRTGSRRAGSVIVAHRPSRSAARGILPDQGSNPCPLHWQADSQPLRHQGSPLIVVLTCIVLMTNDAEYVFMCLFAICISSLVSIWLNFLPIFKKTGLFVFLLLSF